MTNIENNMKSDAAVGLCKGIGLLGIVCGIQLSDVQAVFAILASLAAGIYATMNAYVLWRDKIKRRKR